MCRVTSSCSNASCMPRSFAPPQPKQWFSRFGFSSIPVRSSDQRDSSARFVPTATLPLAELRLEQPGELLNSLCNALLIYSRKTQTQRVGPRLLRLKVSPRQEQYPALAGVYEQLASVKTGRQSYPERHTALRMRPGGAIRHVPLERLFHRGEAIEV